METDFKKSEARVLKFWKDNKIFEKSLEQRKDAKPFVFFEGPPTANGAPGLHHVLARAYKDLYCRYKTMRGFYVLRKAGWDTHGLPVEIEVEKSLGFKNKKDIEEYGIAKFNKKCRESVWKYRAQWEQMTERMGYWVDLKHPYVTYETNYIESLWWIIRQMAGKKLFYRGHKVLPYCPRCGTTLSSHEVAQGYKDITETSVYIKFKLTKQGSPFDKASVLAWTTTPWTLPGNIALAISENVTYVLVEFGGDRLILAKDLLKVIPENSKVIKEFKGKDLIGLKYEPLFDIPALHSKTSYRIYPAKFVTTEDGTGVVHTAAMYGVDDYEFGREIGLPMHHTVDEQGKFTADVPGFHGRYVKEAEKDIIEYLRKNDLLFKAEPHLHSYPFCWRCDSPLLYYAKDSWFVKMSTLRDKLVKNNSTINWIPEHIREGRFGEFVGDVKDWAFSRERYWATPLPIWKCGHCQNNLVVGSLDELEKNRYRPKNTYYLIRHGQTTKDLINNGRPIIATRLEHDTYDLTPKGVSQIKQLMRKLKKEKIDLIFSSPFLRCKHTAQIASEYLGVDFKTDKRLKEIDFGLTNEGRLAADFPIENIKYFDSKRGDGESWHDVKIRAVSLIKELEQKYEGKKIVLISHGDPLWLMGDLAKYISNNEMVDTRPVNYPKEGQLKKIEFKNWPVNEEGDVDLHRPFVDEIILKCPKCKNKMTRIPELADVWFDSGSMPLAQWHYPFENKKLIDSGRQYPADFICEAIDQTRGWFYTLLAVATALGRKTPYKNVICLGHILDEKGQKMSKSRGNVIGPDEAMDKVGADTVRWFLFTATSPGNSLSLSFRDLEVKYHGFIGTIRNILRFYELYAGSVKATGSPSPVTILDKWLSAALNSLADSVTADLDAYDPITAARKIENFVVNDLSNWWLRRSRERFQKPSSAAELVYSASFFRSVLLELAKILAPFTPFVSEEIHSDLHRGMKAGKESVHLHEWPEISEKRTAKSKKEDLEKDMADIRNFAALGLAVRKNKQLKVRQPLATAVLKRKNKFEPELERLLKDELNVKEIRYDSGQADEIALDEKLTEELVREGTAREIMRQIQDMRKEAKYKIDEKVAGAWQSDSAEVIAAIEQFGNNIAKDTLLSNFARGNSEKTVYTIEKNFELSPGNNIWLGIKK